MTFKLALVLTLGAANSATLPDNVTASAIRFIALDSNGTNVGQQDLPVGTTEADFTGLADGKGTATAQYLGSDGNVFGDVVTGSYDDTQVTPPVDGTYTPIASLAATATAE